MIVLIVFTKILDLDLSVLRSCTENEKMHWHKFPINKDMILQKLEFI